jgi:hypothetical protein
MQQEVLKLSVSVVLFFQGVTLAHYNSSPVPTPTVLEQLSCYPEQPLPKLPVRLLLTCRPYHYSTLTLHLSHFLVSTWACPYLLGFPHDQLSFSASLDLLFLLVDS